ncbi:MAG: NlpC/P60 family protein [Acidimicrobiales bacterium]
MRPAEGTLAAARTHGPARILGATRRRARRVGVVAITGASLLVGTVIPAALSTAPAGADSVATLQQRAAALAGQIQSNYDKLSVLDEGYNQAHEKVLHLETAVRAETRAISQAESALKRDQAHLRSVAIEAYVSGSASSQLTSILSSTAQQVPMQQAYITAASGKLANAESSVKLDEHSLSTQRTSLRSAERGAKSAQARIASERRMAQQITNNLESDLAAVKGRLAQVVAAAEQQQRLQQEAASQAAALAREQAIAPTNVPPVPVAVGGGAGATAVRAAESQLGVPYQWGGASPGVGFDCSGLTMWSWGQAGVGLSHGATDQYHEISPVSMSSLSPGDLIFYGNSGYLYHVVMYVGSGPYGSSTVIQAEHTGTNVMYTPLPGGAFGAGRP